MSDKPTTPVASPRVGQGLSPSPIITRDSTTNTSQNKRYSASRLSTGFVTTPERRSRSKNDTLSPSLKRMSSSNGQYKSPDVRNNLYKSPDVRNNNNSVLKTPRYQSPRYIGANESDDEDSTTANGSPVTRSKLQKTPQFFSSAKTLFQDGEDLSEISSQLKNRLSSAFGKLKGDPGSPSASLTFTEVSLDGAMSPTKRIKATRPVENTPWTPSTSLQRLNLNLQTLQQSPLPQVKSSMFPSSPTNMQHFQTCFKQEEGDDMMSTSEYRQTPLQNSPFDDSRPPSIINVPGADESSAHNALLAALSRQQKSPAKRGRDGKEREPSNRRSTDFSKRGSKRNSVDLSKRAERNSMDLSKRMDRNSIDLSKRNSMDLSKRNSIDLSKRNSVDFSKRNSMDLSKWSNSERNTGDTKRTSTDSKRASMDTKRASTDSKRSSTDFSKRNSMDVKLKRNSADLSNRTDTSRTDKRRSIDFKSLHTQPQLPPLSMALESKGDHEQDAVLSLMSLSSPRALNLHSRTHSWDSNPALSPLASPVQHEMKTGRKRLERSTGVASAAAVLVSPVHSVVDNEETDVDDVSDATVEEE